MANTQYDGRGNKPGDIEERKQVLAYRIIINELVEDYMEDLIDEINKMNIERKKIKLFLIINLICIKEFDKNLVEFVLGDYVPKNILNILNALNDIYNERGNVKNTRKIYPLIEGKLESVFRRFMLHNLNKMEDEEFKSNMDKYKLLFKAFMKNILKVNHYMPDEYKNILILMSYYKFGKEYKIKNWSHHRNNYIHPDLFKYETIDLGKIEIINYSNLLSSYKFESTIFNKLHHLSDKEHSGLNIKAKNCTFIKCRFSNINDLRANFEGSTFIKCELGGFISAFNKSNVCMKNTRYIDCSIDDIKEKNMEEKLKEKGLNFDDNKVYF